MNGNGWQIFGISEINPPYNSPEESNEYCTFSFSNKLLFPSSNILKIMVITSGLF